jgi:hypothetical protein
MVTDVNRQCMGILKLSLDPMQILMHILLKFVVKDSTDQLCHYFQNKASKLFVLWPALFVSAGIFRGTSNFKSTYQNMIKVQNINWQWYILILVLQCCSTVYPGMLKSLLLFRRKRYTTNISSKALQILYHLKRVLWIVWGKVCVVQSLIFLNAYMLLVV